MSRKLYFERALFVVGEQNTGKSVQLRSMFLDWRFGSESKIPTSSRIKETICFSDERGLHVRLTSPHEYEDTPKQYIDKIKSKTFEGRWSFAGALQPKAGNKMPGVVESVKIFIESFSPERVRVCFLSPDRHGILIHNKIDDVNSLVDELIAIESVEVMFIDARFREENGYLLADFFDFT